MYEWSDQQEIYALLLTTQSVLLVHILSSSFIVRAATKPKNCTDTYTDNSKVTKRVEESYLT